MKNNALIIFVRKPELGKVKTRLAASVGDEAALRVYRKLLQHTLDVTRQVDADKYVFYAGDIVKDDEWGRAGFTQLQQFDGDLGMRMQHAFAMLLRRYREVVIIGSDCPTLSAPIIETAFTKLKTVDVVIGPATDGGYYLLGMKSLHPEIFSNIAWSTPTVFEITRKRVAALGLNSEVLPTLTDVDLESDLPEDWRYLVAKD